MARHPPAIETKETNGSNSYDASSSDSSPSPKAAAAAAPKQSSQNKKRIAIIALIFLVIGGTVVGVLLGTGNFFTSSSSNSASSIEAVDAPPSTVAAPTASPPSTTVQPQEQPISSTDAPPTIVVVATTSSDAPTEPATNPPSSLPPMESTTQPTNPPTFGATNNPTMEDRFFVPVNPVPDQRPRGYFNYDKNDTEFGPDAWPRINMDGTYFREFGQDGFGPWAGHLQGHVADSTANRCSEIGKQSPINLEQSMGEGGVCTAAHEIRNRGGAQRLFSPAITKVIESNKLRLIFSRRQCLTLTDESCSTGRPPLADFPNWSSSNTHFSDLLNIDVKVPAEHTIEGQTFDAELQFLHLHLEDSRFGYIGIPIRATVAGFNANYQELLDQFQIVYTLNKIECDQKRRHRRRNRNLRGGESAVNQTDVDDGAHDGTDTVIPNNFTQWAEDVKNRMLQQEFYNPYEKFLTTIFFYRYHGSNTEPPCFPITWFVLLRPLEISFQQLRQTQELILTHTDADCRKTSVHNQEQSVARTIQATANDPATQEPREVMYCRPGDFPQDPDSVVAVP